MATSVKMPSNWQELVQTSMKKAQEKDPTRAIFGLSLPESWKTELAYYTRNGEVSRLFGVKAVTFSGKEIAMIYPQADKEDSKSRKKVG